MARARRDFTTLSSAELADYIHAIDILREPSAADADDESGYGSKAGLRNDRFVGAVSTAATSSCPGIALTSTARKRLQAADARRTANVAVVGTWVGARHGAGGRTSRRRGEHKGRAT
jgi:hypothetical protein